MINVSMFQNKNHSITGFKLSGHAGYAEHGQDVVCAAVSVLVMNTINSIEHFTSDVFMYDEDEEAGRIEFNITSELSAQSELLLKSLFLGLSGIQDGYGQEYIKFTSD